jgi:hypothetical protein
MYVGSPQVGDWGVGVKLEVSLPLCYRYVGDVCVMLGNGGVGVTWEVVLHRC